LKKILFTEENAFSLYENFMLLQKKKIFVAAYSTFAKYFFCEFVNIFFVHYFRDKMTN